MSARCATSSTELRESGSRSSSTRIAQLKKALIGPRSERSKMPRVKPSEPATPEEQLAKRRGAARAEPKRKLQLCGSSTKCPSRAALAARRAATTKLKPIGDGQEDHRLGVRAGALRPRTSTCRRCCAAAAAATSSPRRARRRSSRRGSTARASSRTSPSRSARTTCRSTASRRTSRAGLPGRALDDERALPPRRASCSRRCGRACSTLIRTRADRRRRRDAPPDAERRHAASRRTASSGPSSPPTSDGDLDVAYVFAGGRCGETPKRLLEGTKGMLLVDGYSGYNVVAEVSTPQARRVPRAPAPLLSRGAADGAGRAGGDRSDPRALSRRARSEGADDHWHEGAQLEFRASAPGRSAIGCTAWLDCAEATSIRRRARSRRRDPVRAQPVGRARRLPRRRTRARSTTTRPSDRFAASRSAGRTTSSSATSTPARASPGSTRSSRRARRAASTRSTTSPTSSRACRITLALLRERPRGAKRSPSWIISIGCTCVGSLKLRGVIAT